MCKAFDVDRSSYYEYCKHSKSNRQNENEQYNELIKTIWLKSHIRYGAQALKKIHYLIGYYTTKCLFVLKRVTNLTT